MTQWDQAISSGLWTFLWNFYRDNDFPIEIRMHLAPWLEHWVYQLDPDNPSDAVHFASLLQKELHSTVLKINCVDSQSLLARQTLTEIMTRISQKYYTNPTGLLRTIRYCLDQERQRINSVNQQHSGHQQGSPASPPTPMGSGSGSGVLPPTPIMQIIAKLRRIVPFPDHPEQTLVEDCKQAFQEVENATDQIQCERDSIISIETEIQENEPSVNGVTSQQQRRAQLANHKIALSQWMHNLRESLKKFTPKMGDTLKHLNNAVGELVQELDKWKDEQRLFALGFPVPRPLDKMAELFGISASGLLELLRNQNLVKEYIRKEIGCFPQSEKEQVLNNFQRIDQEIAKLMTILVERTFIVEIQPPPIVRLKSEIKILKHVEEGRLSEKSKPSEKYSHVKVRLLVGPAICKTATFKVKVAVLSEDEVAKLQVNPAYSPKVTGVMTNTDKQMSWDRSTDSFQAEFSKLKLMERPADLNKKEGGGRRKKREESVVVASEKYWLYFSTKFTFMDLSFTLQTTSTGFTAASHPSQDRVAWPHSMWINAFFSRADVTIDELLVVLSKVFQKNTLRGLTPENLNFLRSKLLRYPEGQKSTWDHFHELMEDCYQTPKELDMEATLKAKGEVMEKAPISFANWFFAIMKLCQFSEGAKEGGNIHKEWEQGYVEGFISREETEAKLKTCEPSTIMMRFSDTLLEAVTINWLNHQTGQIEKYSPFQPVDLKALSLSQRILDKVQYKYIYPNVPKQALRVSLNEIQDRKIELVRRGYFISKLKEVDVPTDLSRTQSRERQESGSSFSSSFATSSNSGTPFSPTPSADSPSSAGTSTGFGGGFSPMQTQRYSGGGQVCSTPEFDWRAANLDLMEEFDSSELIDEMEASGWAHYPPSD